MEEASRGPGRRILRGVLVLAAVQAAAFAAGRLVARRIDHGTVGDDEIRRVALMGGVNLELTSQSFQNARFDLGMGGVNVDLTAAALAPDGATIDVHGAMGGVNIEVPAGWRVTGDSANRTSGLNLNATSEDELASDAPHLHVLLHARMSGVNVDTS